MLKRYGENRPAWEEYPSSVSEFLKVFWCTENIAVAIFWQILFTILTLSMLELFIKTI